MLYLGQDMYIFVQATEEGRFVWEGGRRWVFFKVSWDELRWVGKVEEFFICICKCDSVLVFIN